MSSALQDTVHELAATWKNGNKKDAVDGLLKMKNKARLAQAVVYFYLELVGVPPEGTQTRYDVNVLLRALENRERGG
jgi:hypothetical protein